MKQNKIDLFWHKYKLFPYEKKFAIREIHSLLEPKSLEDLGTKITLLDPKNINPLSSLVYFSHFIVDNVPISTTQHQYESTLTIDDKLRSKRQNTRYSVHGLHEYKGKFNPQVVRSLFNIFGITKGQIILDPFCGSGTTIIEAAHTGINAVGTDINPLATMIANTKVEALNIKWQDLTSQKNVLFENFIEQNGLELNIDESLRGQYLRSWFPNEVLKEMEALKNAATFLDKSACSVFLIIISNLLRDYSLQEPSDLRIRRRISPFPNIAFIDAVKSSINLFIHSLKVFQEEFGTINSSNHAYNLPIVNFDEESKIKERFDFAITSPPYATALPYIDTQRLSLIWLDLVEPKRIKGLESELIGSREFNFKADKDKWLEYLQQNSFNLPNSIHLFCLNLMNKLSEHDGFRKKALPTLLYRYFCEMQGAIQSVYNQLKFDKYFALIVGHNHTTIGGIRTEIDTPFFLASLGENIGFTIHEVTKLEAYQRYGLHALNAVQSESLIVFKK
jgi:SAM-dependent methyltransferase